jgi:hypothetical protein
MERPESGYYRNILHMYPKIRIAFTNSPIIGCTVVDNTKILEELRKSEDKFAQYYINGIENNEMVTIFENEFEKTWANNGELYFKT